MTDHPAGPERAVNRRDLFIAGSAIVGSGLAATGFAGSAAGAEPDRSHVSGVVVGHPAPDVLEVVPSGSEMSVEVQLVAGAAVVHDGKLGVAPTQFPVGQSVTFDLAEPLAEHGEPNVRMRPVVTAVHMADCRPGEWATRGRPVE